MDHFKTCIMNNLIGEMTVTMPSYYKLQMEEIKSHKETSEEKEVFLKNLERAYNKINEELFGDRGKK